MSTCSRCGSSTITYRQTPAAKWLPYDSRPTAYAPGVGGLAYSESRGWVNADDVLPPPSEILVRHRCVPSAEPAALGDLLDNWLPAAAPPPPPSEHGKPRRRLRAVV